MANKKKKKSKRPSAANHRSSKGRKKSRNPGSVSVASLRSMFSKAKKKSGRRKGSRNPHVFGQSTAKGIGSILLGVAGGVTAVKLLSPMMPASWQSTDMSRAITSAGVALLTSVAAHFTLSTPYRDAVIAGAGAQTLSIILNPVVRKVLPSAPGLMGYRRNALGDFVPANFPEPHNPIYNRMIAAAAAGGGAPSLGGGSMGKYGGRWG